MRKTMMLGTAAAALFAATLAMPVTTAPATAAVPQPIPVSQPGFQGPSAGSPTCLMTATVAKGTLCAHLVQSGSELSAEGTYQSSGTQAVTLTVTVDSGGLQQPTAVLATNTMTGIGNLTATTSAVAPPANATLLRACAKLTHPGQQGYLLVCTAS